MKRYERLAKDSAGDGADVYPYKSMKKDFLTRVSKAFDPAGHNPARLNYGGAELDVQYSVKNQVVNNHPNTDQDTYNT